MPEQLFYNTGIATYVWVLTNRKEEKRRGRVQLIDATDFWVPMRKNMGDKRREISAQHMQQIIELFLSFSEEECSKIFDTRDFGYRKITIERPLRLNFSASPQRIEKLKEQKAFSDLATSKKKNIEEKATEEAAGHAQQEAMLAMLATLPDQLYKDRAIFEQALDKAAKGAGIKLAPPLRKAVLTALGERDESAAPCLDKDGNPELDPELRDTENMPLDQDIQAYFEREVQPYVPDAWVNTTIRDHKDKQVGKVGYEINFNRYFYTYQPPRPLAEIEADIKAIERDILELLREVAG